MLFLIFAGVVGIVAGWSDARTGRIPNRLTFPALLAGIAARGMFQESSGLVFALLGMVAVALVPAVLFAFSKGRAIGGGDVKLFASLGAWLGPALGVEAQFLSFAILLAGVFVVLVWRGRLLVVVAGAAALAVRCVCPERWMRRVWPEQWQCPSRAETSTPVRMGPAIAAGTLVVCFLEGAGWSG